MFHLIAGLAFGTVASAQPPVPLSDPVSTPLLPPDILPHDVQVDAQLAYAWITDEKEQVVHGVGDFSMHIGGRSISAQQGVVWVSNAQHENRPYRHYEMLLFHDARIVESGGTVTEGPVLFVTVNGTGELFLSADRNTFASSADTTVYQDAVRVRQAMRAGVAAAPGDGATIMALPRDDRGALPPPELVYSGQDAKLSTLDDGRRVVTILGQVHLFRGEGGTGDVVAGTLELRADSAVLFLAPSDQGADALMPLLRQGDETSMEAAAGGGAVEGVYLEGDVRMTFGERTVRADRLYYDLANERAIILDAVMFALLPDRDLPIYIRAAEIRQLSSRAYSADHARLSTSEFHTPHYHVGAGRIDIVDRTPRALTGERLGLSRAVFDVRDAAFHLYNLPLLYWPRARGNVSRGDTAIRGVNVGASDDFGASVETEWDLFQLLSLEPPLGFTGDLLLDYFSKRGPAAGVNLDWETSNSFGLFRGYVIDDRGDDNLGEFRDNVRDDDERGRATLRHRHYLPDDWQLTVEASYISDRTFLEEYNEREFDEEKEQETLFSLKKQRDNWALSAIAQARWNDFYTQTERMPDFSFHLVGEPLGDVATWYSENRAGMVRRRAAEKELFIWLREGSDGPSSGATARVDSRQEITLPLHWGDVNVVPFVALRGTMWDDSPTGGGLSRGLAIYGVRSAMYLSRAYPDVESDMWDVHGLRHVIKPEVVAWGAHANHDADDLYAFDSSVEGIDDFDGLKVGVEQRWQTKRGPADSRRVVDWITWDVEMGLFHEPSGDAITNGFVSYSRPENSVARNFVNSSLVWRINDATALASEVNYDMNDGEVDIFNLSLAVERSPRFGYLLAYRFIEEQDSNLLEFGVNYKIDEKHTVAVREAFDLDRGDTLDFTVAYIRKYPRWFVALMFELDEAEDNAGVSIAIWPEGLPRAALGSRRFTGVAESVAMGRN